MAIAPKMEVVISFKKPSWWQRIWRKKEPHSYNRKNVSFDYVFEMYHEQRSLFGYMRENINYCTDLAKHPSSKILKRYNISHNTSNMFVWWLMEQYFEGNLVLKEKDKETHG